MAYPVSINLKRDSSIAPYSKAAPPYIIAESLHEEIGEDG